MLPEKILLLMSLPNTAEFEREKEKVDNFIDAMRQLKIVVHCEINEKLLATADHFDLVIVIAHHSEERDCLILHDQEMEMTDFINHLPANFHGILDFSSCYAARSIQQIKKHCPNCRVHAPLNQTALLARLSIYHVLIPALIQNVDMPYAELYKTVATVLASQAPVNQSNATSETTLVLGPDVSSIYAPSKVKRGDHFFVNIFIHKEEDEEEIKLQALRLDPRTEKIVMDELDIEIQRGDRITARMEIYGRQSKYVLLDNGIDTQNAKLSGNARRIQFGMTVDEAIPDEHFDCKVMLAVNGESVAECYFSVQVAEEESDAPAYTEIRSHNHKKEREEIRAKLRGDLEKHLNDIQKKIETEINPNTLAELKTSADICRKCLKMIDDINIIVDYNARKEIFISSTSEMAHYRDLICNEILKLDMFPVDYRQWQQNDNLPSDECCKRVLESDVLLCVLGANYGYKEPSLNLSMTQMEYRIAVLSGKKIRAYIKDPRHESQENEDAKLRQNNFIDEVEKHKIITKFADDIEIRTAVARELAEIKYKHYSHE